MRGTLKEHWRTPIVGLLLAAAVAEAWWASTVQVAVSGMTAQKCVMVCLCGILSLSLDSPLPETNQLP